MSVLLLGALALCLSIFFTKLIRRLAIRWDVVDRPMEERKIHVLPMPLLGGVAVFLALLSALSAYYFFKPLSFPPLFDVTVSLKNLVGIFLGSLILIIGGAIDDRFRLKPYVSFLFPFCAIIIIMMFGIGVKEITNPFGSGTLSLEHTNVVLFWWNSLPRYLTLPSDLITFAWLLGTMYTTKLLDGLDGLVSGVTVIGAVIIACVSLFVFVNIPTALFSAAIVGAFGGFLLFNFHPAKIFLGEGGSTMAGFLLGVLALLSGSKFITLFLILGIPLLDVGWTVIRRVIIEKRSPFSGDRKHLHFRLLDAGLSHRQAVLVFYFFAAFFGSAVFFLQRSEKIIALALVVFTAFFIGFLLFRRAQRLKPPAGRQAGLGR